jgi:Spy/CpxP family protein refolding chaperone
MKTPQILLIVLAFALGLGVMAALNSTKSEEGNKQALNENKDTKASVDASTDGPVATPAIEPQKSPEGLPSAITAPAANAFDNEGQDEDLNPEDAFAQILNSPQARSLMKQMAGAMTRGADRMIEGAVNEYGEKLNLTEAQSASIKAKMASLMEESSKKFQSELDDDSRSMREIMESQGDFWRNNEEDIEGILKEELSAEQFEQFERLQLEEDTENIQRRANWELGAIDRALDLSEAQEDQVFGILVRQSDDYDASMAIEGIETDLPPAAIADDVSKEDAIRSVLTPEQTETYNSKVEDGGFGRSGRGRWGRGFGRPR